MTLNQRIQQFYDQSTQVWLDMWGEHMHHGHYGADGKEQKDNMQAQLDLITEMLKWGQVENVHSFLDAGCGVGGSARFLASLYGAKGLGVTLSGVQAKEAKRLTREVGLQDQLRFETMDMMMLSNMSGPFDFVWSMESAEHIENKQALFELFYNILEPGGRLLMATWCHRATPPALSPQEQKLLNNIYKLYHLPPMVSISELEQMAQQVGFVKVATANWTAAVSPFWKAVIRSALSLSGIKGLLRSGPQTIKGAWAMRYMTKGFKTGLLEFGLVQAQKKA